MSSTRVVERYFDAEAERFDAIYESEKPFHQRLVDAMFRRVVVERFQLVCNLAPCAGPWSVLDVGCGPGRYSIALARKGARRVVGVDVSRPMIELARREVERSGLGDRVELAVSEFLDYPAGATFDVVVAMGYFDYLQEPLPHLQRLVAFSQGRIFISFPKRWEIRVPMRKARFWWEGGFVRFYGKREIQRLVQAAGIAPDRLSLIDLGRDWIAVIGAD